MGLKRKFAPRREDSEGEEGPMLMLETEARRPTRFDIDFLDDHFGHGLKLHCIAEYEVGQHCC